MIITQRDIIACLSVQENGDWDRIYQRIRNSDIPEQEVIRSVVDNIPCGFITLGEDCYPPQLAEVYKPPFTLFYYGDISIITNPDNRLVGVIGSRDSSEYGERMTRKIVGEIAKDFPIVSGLAKGIDAVAAKQAIEFGGKTVAVIGCGLDICYPEENLELFNLIKKEHLCISEYPMGISPDRSHFPMRNRIIAGLCESIVVTEASKISGTSITVTQGLQTGRNILCVPYPATVESACNRLIKEGAYLVENGDDVRECMSFFRHKKYYYGR